ncbi:MAG: hypothetical protein A2X32_08720 [Elusimicrobia bacterium GWC2_64_44]|nr:MAG: hypothetical protein A2X32_08720 [Elusimicrobia bacterium GWC2_64_44]
MNGTEYKAGSEIAWYKVYPFFLFHMFMFGGSGFLMAYAGADTPLVFLFLHGGFAILIYTVFYFAIFGADEVKWMFINAGLGALGIYTQIDWLLSFFGKSAGDYSLARHFIPFLYYVLYTFLLRQALLDLGGAREDEGRRRLVENGYIGVSLAASAACFLLGK